MKVKNITIKKEVLDEFEPTPCDWLDCQEELNARNFFFVDFGTQGVYMMTMCLCDEHAKEFEKDMKGAKP